MTSNQELKTYEKARSSLFHKMVIFQITTLSPVGNQCSTISATFHIGHPHSKTKGLQHTQGQQYNYSLRGAKSYKSTAMVQ